MYSVTGSSANNKWQLTFYLFFLLQWKKTCRVELISYRIGYPRCHCSERNLIKSWGRFSRDIWTTSRKRWLIFNRYFYKTLCSNVMHDSFLIYVTLNCRLYRIFIVLIFQKNFFNFFFLMSVNRLIRWEMSWLSMLEEILSLFRCWLEPMTWDIKQRYNYDFLKFYFLWYCEMLRKSMFKFHGKKTIRKWI